MTTFSLPDLQLLSTLQEELDTFILRKHDLEYDTELTIVAFKVELGELLNEHGFFKRWKKSHKINRSALLEEFADGLHFLVSIGNQRKYVKYTHAIPVLEIKNSAGELKDVALGIYNNHLSSAGHWCQAVFEYLYLGHLLGIDAQTIEQEYKKKHAKNIERQKNNY